MENIRAGAIKTLSDYENAVRQKEEAQGRWRPLYAAAEEYAARMRDKDVEAEGVRFQMMQREADANGLENAVAVLRPTSRTTWRTGTASSGSWSSRGGRADSIGAQIAERKERLEALVGELDTLGGGAVRETGGGRGGRPLRRHPGRRAGGAAPEAGGGKRLRLRGQGSALRPGRRGPGAAGPG